MAYSLNGIQREPFRGGKNILASEHVQFIEVGGTLDAAAFGAGTVEIGTLVARNETTGKFEPYTETTAGTFEPGYTDPAVLNIDVEIASADADGDVVVGELIIRGSVYQAKIPAAPTDAFKAKNDNIRFIPER